MPRLEIPYNPFPVHAPFHATNAREKAAIGAVGSGKTIALVADCLIHCLEQPGSVAMLCRQTVASLRDTTEAEFVNLISQPPPDYNGDEEDLVTLYDLCEVRRGGGHIDKIFLPNGSEVRFRSLDDWRKLMSYNVSYVGIDEANETDAETYINLMSRLRQFQPTARARRKGTKWVRSQVRQQMAIACNPDGHNWVWEYFVHAPTEQRRYFKSSSFDNPTLYNEDGTPSAFLRSLLTMPEMWIKRFVLCEFDVMVGQIYNFDFDLHVHQHFVPPPDWERGMGLDWGIRNPTAIGWWARKPGTTKWYKYREWQSYDPMNQNARETYQSVSVDNVAMVIKRLEAGEHIKWRGADPMIWRRQTGDKENRTIEYFFRKHGLFFQPGAKDYSTRINAVNLLLGRREISVSTDCPMTMVANQQYRWADLTVDRGDKDPQERPRKQNDHLVDADQYFFTLFTQASPPQVTEPTENREQIMLNWQNEIRSAMKPKPPRRRR
jgi:hypothetical protein